MVLYIQNTYRKKGNCLINKYLNNMIAHMGKILGCKVGIIDSSGVAVASGGCSAIEGKYKQIFSLCLDDKRHFAVLDGYTFYAVVTRNKVDYVSFVKSVESDAEKLAQLVASSAGGMRQMHNDKFDKSNFIKNILTDSILPGDVFVKSKELKLVYDAPRVAFVLQYDDVNGTDVFDIVSELFPEEEKDFVIDLDNNIIVIVSEIEKNTKSKEINEMANQIIDTVNTEAMTSVRVGIGTVAEDVKNIAKSYKEARIALEVGKVFDEDKFIINYENLGIARIIYQLPTTLCELFLSEVFKKGSIDSLDAETLYTIQKFFENNLNVSETSRQLYVHRNTLVYRLDKVRKITGLDLRVFDDAIVFKVALMVKKYLVSKPMRI